MHFNEYDFKHCVGSFATGVTVVTTLDGEGKPVGVTISSFASLSLHPPLVLFCLDKTAASFIHFDRAEYFVINILSNEQEYLSRRFSTPGYKWENVEFTKDETGCPVLKGVLAYLECKKEVVYEGGDHKIFVGRVVNLKWVSETGKPLLHHRGQYIS